MGKEKPESERKRQHIVIRVTADEKATIVRQSRLAGYSSVSRYIIETAGRLRLTPKRPKEPIEQGLIDEIFKKDIALLTRQVKGVAANYNQVTEVLHTLIRTVSDNAVKARIVRRSSTLETLTKELIRYLHMINAKVAELDKPLEATEVEEDVEGDREEGGKEATEGAVLTETSEVTEVE